MSSPERVHTITYLTLQEVAKELLKFENYSKNETYFKLATLPTDFLKTVCTAFNTDIWKHLAITEVKIPIAYQFLKKINEPEKSTHKKALTAFFKVVNPVFATTKELLAWSNEEKTSATLAENGSDLALPLFEELHSRGASLSDIEEQILSFYDSYSERARIKRLERTDFEKRIEIMALKRRVINSSSQKVRNLKSSSLRKLSDLKDSTTSGVMRAKEILRKR